jgi:hypothetical protein
MKTSEKILFFTLWGFILLGVGLWKFRVKTPTDQPAAVELVLNQELGSFFSSAVLTSEDKDSYQVKFSVHPTYLASLSGDSTRLHLKYDLLVNEKVAYENTIAVTVLPHKSELATSLPNPLKLSSKTIALSLAR